MKRATPAIRALATRLVRHELQLGNTSATSAAPAAFTVCEKLGPHLVPLMGKAGFRVLLSRALTVTSEEVHWLHVLKVDADGRLLGMEKVKPAHDAARFERECAVLPAVLIALLVAFVGERLTLGIIREVWPTLPDSPRNFGKGKTK